MYTDEMVPYVTFKRFINIFNFQKYTLGSAIHTESPIRYTIHFHFHGQQQTTALRVGNVENDKMKKSST